MGRSVGWCIGAKIGSSGTVFVEGEMRSLGSHERTLLYSVDGFNIYDHPERLIGVFEPTSDRWIERVWESV